MICDRRIFFSYVFEVYSKASPIFGQQKYVASDISNEGPVGGSEAVLPLRNVISDVCL